MIVYYSGCGNSRWVAQTLAGRLQERLTFLPDTSADISLQDGEAIGFVFPVYAWAPPRLVLEFVRRMQLTHHPSYVWFACTCGDEGAFTRQVFSRALRKAGLNLDACFCLQMPETYIAFPGFALDTPANAQRKINSVRNDLPRIAELINHRERQHFEMIWGIFPLTKTYVLQPLFYRFIITDRQFLMREPLNNNIAQRFERDLSAYFNSEQLTLDGVPSVRYFAEQQHLTASYFGDAIKTATGRSPQQIIQERLIALAKDKLASSDLSVKEVAYALGYEYPQYFVRAFRKHTGHTPTQYRSLMRQVS